MKNKRARVLFHFLLKTILVLVIIWVNILFQRHPNFLSQSIKNDISSVAIIGGADGPTTIFMAAHNGWLFVLKYALSIILIIGLLILMVFDIIELIKNPRHEWRGIEDLSLKDLCMRGNKSPAPPVLRPKGRGIKP